MITANGLRKDFDEIRAVDELSLEIRTGETFGLLGPNGAGKSTTINILVGLIKPDSGSIAVDVGGSSSDPTDLETRKLIGVAPQSLSLYEDLSARENLEFFAQLYGLHGELLRQQVEWALDFAKLEDRQKDLVSTFSGGMKRRLNIAVAMIHSPKVLFLDEPTVGVDPQSRNHIFECIEKLRSKGLTIVYTTHYMEEASRLCDRVGIIDKGKMLALDTVDQLIERYGGESFVNAELSPSSQSSDLPGDFDGRTLSFRSSNPLEEIAKLSSRGVDFRTLNVSRPDLEAVFLSLTGRSLRD